ncbi:MULTISPECIES: helix-turn-helix domain-containing protein [Rhizobium]|uniref:Putative XRE-type DNA-binding protein n=1 Tax=Rhizobium paranaense TaxID=1650438 RepID=A0A7W9D1G9_9HYPH|nr:MULTISPECIES: helix-turn-helix transcriptional regulator [Rhizobium]MBB5573846.1 putative XRE-type DNA-binding protein [Rhizobium paranaense]PST61432.1 XRE family transcriptional regulator [Rhizobium sp. SEMIA4064]
MSDNDFEVVRGSGNIYADLGDPDADAKQMKTQLAAEIIAALDRRKLTVRDGEKLTGVTAADLSRIRNADLSRFTIDRLVRVLNALDRHVTVKVTRMPKRSKEPAAASA